MNDLKPISASSAYELLINGVVDYAIYMLDPSGAVASWNPGAERIKGYSPTEIIGEHFSRFYTDEDRAAGVPVEALRLARETGRFTAEAWRVRKGGARFWAMVVIDAVRDEAGELIGFAKITRDMTEHRQTQLANQEAERRFRILVEGVTDYAIYMLDPQGQVTNWNAGAERIKGYKAEQIVGQHFSRFYTPEDAEAGAPARALETARREGRFEAEGWRIRSNGERFWAGVVIDTIRDEAGELMGFAKITRDLTERRENEARLTESREQLVQAQKMDALGQLTGGMAHDFNNLLTAIMGAAELGLRQSGDNEKLKRMLEGIRASAERGGKLTRQLLSFARRQPLEPKVVDLLEQLPTTVQLLHASMRGDIEIITEFSEGLQPIEVDPGQLELAMLNLAINARDAMPDGGTLRLGAHNVVLQGEVEGCIGEFVALSVCDTGVGIPPEIRDRIFEPFFTTKSFGQGTGLGLSQTYGFVRQSNGAMAVTSTVGEGTIVTVYLPVRGMSGQANLEGDAAARTIVLVVEDEPFVAELAAELVREIGYEPQVAHSAAEALLVLTRAPDVKLVFTDVIMPGGISGVELARKVRARYPELPVLLTTGYSQAAIELGGEFPLISKPYNMDQLSASLRRLLERKDAA